MGEWTGKRILVVGLGASGLAAGRLLLAHGAVVTAADAADTPRLRDSVQPLRDAGATVQLGTDGQGLAGFDLVVVSPGVPLSQPIVARQRALGVPVIGELELGYRHSRCPNISITGTNGKTTTTELVALMLQGAHRRTIAAGNIGLPLCAVAEQSNDLDYLTLEVSSFQLETIEFFRPSVAVLMNITPDHLDRHATMAEYARAKARLFKNQQVFDWAIVQYEALQQLQALGAAPSAKTITFSARETAADLYLDRSLLVSRLPDWSGPLLDMSRCQLIGQHNAENLMAALAVGRLLRLSLEEMRSTLEQYQPQEHRCECVAEIAGVRFYNDSKGTNVDALRNALEAMPEGPGGRKNVWLIAGGLDKGLDFHDVGPMLAERVKGAFLLGQAREKIRSAWGLFTACTLTDTLADCVAGAGREATPGDVVLLSPACASFDMFENYKARGKAFRELVEHWGHQQRESAEATYQQAAHKS